MRKDQTPEKERKKREGFSSKHPYLTNSIVAAIACIVIMGLADFGLDLFTRHGRSYAVPDFTDMSLHDAQVLAKEHHLELVVTDSVYVTHRPRGIVFRQNPKHGALVKKNRRIFLTINSIMPRMVEMPDIVGYSLRQAKAVLMSNHLRVGTLNYVSDMATNNVLQQKFKGTVIDPGTELPTDSYIDLEMGLNSYNEVTIIPLLIGSSLMEAKDLLVEASLNSGAVKYDNTVKTYADSLFAKVYKQTPIASESPVWTLGLKVELWLTMDDSKIENK
jgi:hypothetical protein